MCCAGLFRVMAISGGEKELLQTEGTVILHISFALKQGQELRKEYLKLLEVSWYTYLYHSRVLLINVADYSSKAVFYCALSFQCCPLSFCGKNTQV